MSCEHPEIRKFTHPHCLYEFWMLEGVAPAFCPYCGTPFKRAIELREWIPNEQPDKEPAD